MKGKGYRMNKKFQIIPNNSAKFYLIPKTKLILFIGSHGIPK